ncbi:MAG: DNA primase small subunit PriS [Candidatus Bathyarchaeia archaeon]
MERREFGFVMFEGFMSRHRSFKDMEELKEFLESSTPTDAYYSCAYYENPTVEMDKKGWLGADLIFDVDADHIPTSCDKIHDEWKCGNCGFSGKGITPEKCPACSSEKIDVITWPCEVCLESAKAETVKLLDMLSRDFGFSDKEIQVFFSGHRGYHVHVESESVKTLDATARKEIVDYITCLGLETSFYYANKEAGKMPPESLSLVNYGWGKRLTTGVANFIREAREEDFIKIGIKRNIAKTINQNKDKLLKSWTNSRIWGSIKGVGAEAWRKMVEYVAKMQSAKIDTVVTTDIHRLIRLPETLHGKTGFKKTELPVSKIDVFDPFRNAVAFTKNTATVFVSDAPKFRLNGETFGPYKKQKVELPTAAAVLLVCKNKAEVLD